jgi:hypothetical protein
MTLAIDGLTAAEVVRHLGLEPHPAFLFSGFEAPPGWQPTSRSAGRSEP